MRSILLAFAATVTLLTATAGAAMAPTVVMPGQEKYMAQPGNYQMAVLYGNPGKGGFWTVRLKLPANWTFPVHYHPGRENVTVIQGTFYAGIGSKMNRAKAIAFTQGSFISVPPNLPHFAFTKGAAVIDIAGDGVLQDVMVK